MGGKFKSHRGMIFDTETTGLDTETDQIVELACQEIGMHPNVLRLRPSVRISDEAQAVHGISMEDVEFCPDFHGVAGDVRQWFDGIDVLVGYNVGFDIAILDAEFRRVGMHDVLDGKVVVDAYKLWMRKAPRDLISAFAEFCPDWEYPDAHSAAGDVKATENVLTAMLDRWELNPDCNPDWDALATICEPQRANFVGTTNHFLWDGNVVVFGFGKHKGKPISQSHDYLRWMLGSNFPASVKDVINRELNGTLTR